MQPLRNPVGIKAILWSLGLGVGISAISEPARASDFSVGTSGTYPTIQSAINAALTSHGDHRILVQRGDYVERIAASNGFVFPNCFEGSVHILGGYEESFSDTLRSPDATLTSIKSPADTSSLATIRLESNGTCASPWGDFYTVPSEIRMDGFKFTGVATSVNAIAYNGGKLIFGHNVIEGIGIDSTIYRYNPVISLRAENNARGNNPSHLEFTQNTITGNEGQQRELVLARAYGDSSRLFLPTPLLEIHDNQFTGNRSEQGMDDHCATAIEVEFGHAAVLLTDNVFNQDSCSMTGALMGPVYEVFVGDNGAGGKVFFERNRIDYAQAVAIGVSAASDAHALANVTIANNLVNHSADFSIEIAAADAISAMPLPPQMAVNIVNNTLINSGVVGGSGTAIVTDGTPTIELNLVNNIFWRNGFDIGGRVTGVNSHNSWSAVDPLFANETASDFCLRSDSPNVDAGDANGHSGSSDLDLNHRVNGASVNIGALECNN